MNPDHEIVEPWTVDKTGWGEGPWNDEPDKLNWITRAGLDGMIVRSEFAGSLCGYVGVPRGHALYGVAHNRIREGVTQIQDFGLSYSNSCVPPICHIPEPGRPDDVWWLGFDCHHYPWELGPAFRMRERELLKDAPEHLLDHVENEISKAVYREIPYVKARVEAIATAIKQRKYVLLKSRGNR